MMYHFKNEKTDEPSVFSILKIVYKKSNCYSITKTVNHFLQRLKNLITKTKFAQWGSTQEYKEAKGSGIIKVTVSFSKKYDIIKRKKEGWNKNE